MAHTFPYNVMKLRGVVLLTFLIYALSPVGLTIQAAGGKKFVDNKSDGTSITVGIVWLKTLITTMTGLDPDDIDKDGDPEGDQIIVASSDAVSRGKIRFKPLQLFHQIITFDVATNLFVPRYEYTRIGNVRVRECDEYSSLKTGLSPPLFFS